MEIIFQEDRRGQQNVTEWENWPTVVQFEPAKVSNKEQTKFRSEAHKW